MPKEWGIHGYNSDGAGTFDLSGNDTEMKEPHATKINKVPQGQDYGRESDTNGDKLDGAQESEEVPQVKKWVKPGETTKNNLGPVEEKELNNTTEKNLDELEVRRENI